MLKDREVMIHNYSEDMMTSRKISMNLQGYKIYELTVEREREREEEMEEVREIHRE